MKSWLLSLLFIPLISGCMSNGFISNDDGIESAQQRIADARRMPPAPPVRIDRGYYVDTTPVTKSPDAAWLQQPIEVHARHMTLANMLTHLLQRQPVVLHFQSGLQTNRQVHLDYRGNLRGALDRLAAQCNHAYTATAHDLRWAQFQTKTFNIAFMPGTAEYLIGQTANKDGASDSSNNNTNLVTTQGHLYDAQHSNLQANLSVWQDLRKALVQMKSPDGQVMVSEATTSVTVRDYPDRVATMARFIAELNRTLSQQVNVKIHVIDVELNDDFNIGIDWNVVQRAAGTQIRLVGALGTATNLTSTSVASTAASSGLTTLSFGTTPKAVINALNDQGKVSVVTEPEVTTMNNQIAEVRITRDTGYLQSVSTTSIANQGSTTALTPGVVTDGFSLFLLPKIRHHEVYLQISSTLSTLTQLVQVSNQVSGTTNNNIQAIQVPTLSEKHFNQRTRVRSGRTLIITGFKQMHHQVKQSAPFGFSPVGGVGAEGHRVQTVVMITPTIVERAD